MHWASQPHRVSVCLALILLASQTDSGLASYWHFKGELHSFEGGRHLFDRQGFDSPGSRIREPEGPGLFQAISFPVLEAEPETHKLRTGVEVIFTLEGWRSARAVAVASATYRDIITTTPPPGATATNGYLRFRWHVTGQLDHNPRVLPLDATLRRARLTEAVLGITYTTFYGARGNENETLGSLGAYHSIGDDSDQTDYNDVWRDDQLEGPMFSAEDLDSTPPTITVSRDISLAVPWTAGEALDITYFLSTGANIRYDLVEGNPYVIFSAVGTGAFFYNTATLRSLEVLDENFNRIAGPEAIHSANGYIYPVPEPACVGLLVCGLVLAGLTRSSRTGQCESGNCW